MPNALEGVIGEPCSETASLRDVELRLSTAKLITYGVFLLRILFCMCSFLGLTGPIPLSSRLLTSLSSGKKLPVADDMLALF